MTIIKFLLIKDEFFAKPKWNGLVLKTCFILSFDKIDLKNDIN